MTTLYNKNVVIKPQTDTLTNLIGERTCDSYSKERTITYDVGRSSAY